MTAGPPSARSRAELKAAMFGFVAGVFLSNLAFGLAAFLIVTRLVNP